MFGFSGRLPVISLNDGQADLALLVYIGMVDLGTEVYLGRLERVFCGKVDLNTESPLVIRSSFLEYAAHDYD